MSQGVSIKPSDFTKGGLLDDEDVVFKKLRFVRGEDTDIQNYPDIEEKLFVHLVVSDEIGEEIENYYSAGVLEYFEPSEDGKRAIPVSSSSTLRSNCNFAFFMASIVNAGYPEDKLSDDLSVFEGLKCHMVRVPGPRRSGLGESKPVLIVEKIHEPYPWDGAKKPKAKSNAKPSKENSGADLTDETSGVIMEILAEAEEPVKKTSLFKVMLKKLAENGNPNKKQMIKLAADNAFLEAGDWEFDGNVLSLG
jgi:hypothetical protein